MNPLKYLSICSGICASTVAWQWLDWSPIAFSEIEPFPSAVLAHRHPGVPNLGDMTRFPEWPEELLAEVDLLVGGTPCQAFSVAGLRASLSDDRGNLTLVYVALVNHIDTIRAAHGRPPVICVWENVPGVLSTKDNAFGCFLGGLAGAGLPLLAPGGAWEYAGYVRGPLRAIAWRSLDAQYFGVPQRRHRVFAVASAGDGFRPEEILFESEGLRRDSPPRREAWENPAPTLSARTNGGGGLGTDFNLDGGLISSTGEISHCLNAGGMGRQDYETETMICSLPAVCPSCCHSLIDKNLAVCGDTCPACSDPLLGVSHSLRAQPQSAHDASLETYVTHALTAEGHDASEDGTGRGTPIIPVPFGVDESPDVAHCLRSGASKADKHESTTYIAQHIGFDSLQAGDTMMGITYDGSPPLRGCQGRVAVAFAENSRAEIRLENGDGQQTGALSTGGGKPGQGTPTIAYTLHGTDGTTSVVSEDDTAQCLLARAPGIANSASTIVLSYAVRRLTPRECERLQGFPDDFTQIPWRGKPVDQCPDGPRYKALGNSMAVTCMLWIGRRIAAYLSQLSTIHPQLIG